MLFTEDAFWRCFYCFVLKLGLNPIFSQSKFLVGSFPIVLIQFRAVGQIRGSSWPIQQLSASFHSGKMHFEKMLFHLNASKMHFISIFEERIRQKRIFRPKKMISNASTFFARGTTSRIVFRLLKPFKRRLL